MYSVVVFLLLSACVHSDSVIMGVASVVRCPLQRGGCSHAPRVP